MLGGGGGSGSGSGSLIRSFIRSFVRLGRFVSFGDGFSWGRRGGREEDAMGLIGGGVVVLVVWTSFEGWVVCVCVYSMEYFIFYILYLVYCGESVVDEES